LQGSSAISKACDDVLIWLLLLASLALYRSTFYGRIVVADDLSWQSPNHVVATSMCTFTAWTCICTFVLLSPLPIQTADFDCLHFESNYYTLLFLLHFEISLFRMLIHWVSWMTPAHTLFSLYTEVGKLKSFLLFSLNWSRTYFAIHVLMKAKVLRMKTVQLLTAGCDNCSLLPSPLCIALANCWYILHLFTSYTSSRAQFTSIILAPPNADDVTSTSPPINYIAYTALILLISISHNLKVTISIYNKRIYSALFGYRFLCCYCWLRMTQWIVFFKWFLYGRQVINQSHKDTNES